MDKKKFKFGIGPISNTIPIDLHVCTRSYHVKFGHVNGITCEPPTSVICAKDKSFESVA